MPRERARWDRRAAPQRIALARALLKNTPIMVCDEATSALDSVTESEIIETMKHAAEGRTTIIIAHRLSTIMHADAIAVLKDGQVSEIGTHSELLADSNSYYSQMWQQQDELEAKKENAAKEMSEATLRARHSISPKLPSATAVRGLTRTSSRSAAVLPSLTIVPPLRPAGPDLTPSNRAPF